ncbi:MAG: hypothetical protein IH892_18250 [Planctomycetes bacterium]|nr:hypothetical protein [Planctomycetota bacterium]
MRIHPHATATLTTAPRSRNNASANSRRLTVTLYDAASRRHAQCRDPRHDLREQYCVERLAATGLP